MAIPLTRFTKAGGVLTKEIRLGPDGRLMSDGSGCRMWRGRAARVEVTDLADFARLIEGLRSDQAIAIGALRDTIPDDCIVTTKHILRQANGTAPPDLIARTGDALHFEAGRAALGLFDYDSKGQSPAVAARFKELGGYWPALVFIMPGLDAAAHIERDSTSSCIVRTDTNEAMRGSDGKHVYIAVKDGADIPRFLATAHDRAWLCGLGWWYIGAAGQLLERSIVDKTVASPERLIFEAKPVLIPPLEQRGRQPIVFDGEAIVDTLAIYPPLTDIEAAEVARLKAVAHAALEPEAAKVRAAFVTAREDEMVARGVPRERARYAAEHYAGGVLLPNVILDFDNPELAGTTVRDVLADPEKFVGETMSDPWEGRSYGSHKAKIFQRANSSLWINSFAHGGARFELKHDAASVRAGLEGADDQVAVFIRLARQAELSEDEIEQLTAEVAERAGLEARDVRERLESAKEADAIAAEGRGSRRAVTLTDFYCYMPMGNFLFVPSREHWPASSVNARIPPIPISEDVSISASAWIASNRPIEQVTWAPGLPELITDRLITNAGFVDHVGAKIFNQYRPPTIKLGDPTKATRWLDLIYKLYGKEGGDHYIKWCASRVQKPWDKINHSLVIGGKQGIGKDSGLAPVLEAVGPWNCEEVGPQEILGRFSSFKKSVILRISEARDLGEFDRFALYDHLKTLIAAPPDTLRVDEKHLREYYILNVVGVIITTNHKSDGIFLPTDDRRNYVLWSNLEKTDFAEGYWDELWHWYRKEDGFAHVAAYLHAVDLSDFNTKAPPPKTAAFWEIANANAAPEESELADVIDQLGNPDALTLSMLIATATADDSVAYRKFCDWLEDRKNRRAIPHRLESVGYVAVNNPDAKDGYWKLGDRRVVVYGKSALSPPERLGAVRRMVEHNEDWLRDLFRKR